MRDSLIDRACVELGIGEARKRELFPPDGLHPDSWIVRVNEDMKSLIGDDPLKSLPCGRDSCRGKPRRGHRHCRRHEVEEYERIAGYATSLMRQQQQVADVASRIERDAGGAARAKE